MGRNQLNQVIINIESSNNYRRNCGLFHGHLHDIFTLADNVDAGREMVDGRRNFHALEIVHLNRSCEVNLFRVIVVKDCVNSTLVVVYRNFSNRTSA